MSGSGRDSLAVLADIRLRGLHRDMTEAVMHPVLGHALNEIFDDGALVSFHRTVYEPLLVARRKNPSTTLRQLLLDDPAAAVLRRLLGDDQFLLATRVGGAEYFDARARVLAALRNTRPSRQWMAWGHWGEGTPEVELFAGMPRVLPVDHPALRILAGGGVRAGYPTWSTGRKRFFQNLAVAEMIRRLGLDVPIPPDLLHGAMQVRLSIARDVQPIPFFDEPQLELSTTQVLQMVTTGRSPAFKSLLVAPGERPLGYRVSFGVNGRAADDARWELFRRTGDPAFADLPTFAAALAGDPALLTSNTRPITGTAAAHPVTTLSMAELVAVARAAPGAPQIATMAYELEHRRAQRAVRQIERMLSALEQVADPRLIRHLCGLCDPHNLRLVNPYEHGRIDMWAGFTGSGVSLLENPARSMAIQARRGGPDPTADLVPADALYEVAEDPTPPPEREFDAEEDYPRAMNVFFGFSPYQLEPVAQMFQTVDVGGALATFEAAHGIAVAETWDHFAGCVNAAINSYGMNKNLLLDLSYRYPRRPR